MPNLQHPEVVPVASDDLEAYGQPSIVKPAGTEMAGLPTTEMK